MKNKRKLIAVVVSIVIVALVCGIVVLAYLSNHGDVSNTITPAQVSCRVDEVFSGPNTKETVTVANTSDFNVYIRLIAVTYWQDSKGNIVEMASEDLNIENNLNGDWFYGGDNIFYFKKPVQKGDSTSDLFANGFSITLEKEDKPVISDIGTEIFEYHQVVEFIAEAIQTIPADAVENSWNVSVNQDGTITD